MSHNPYAPMIAQFRSETDSASAFRKLVSKFLGGALSHPVRASASRDQSHNAQPDGLAMLAREVDRIRLQSRHWLM
jgi:hypothetical protein